MRASIIAGRGGFVARRMDRSRNTNPTAWLGVKSCTARTRTIASRAGARVPLSMFPSSSRSIVLMLPRNACPTGLRKGSFSVARNPALRRGYDSIVCANHCSARSSLLVMASHAARWFGQSRQLARALGRSRREELVNLVELVSRLLAQLAHHGRDAELEIVVADVMDYLPMPVGEVGNCLGRSEILGHVLVP